MRNLAEAICWLPFIPIHQLLLKRQCQMRSKIWNMKSVTSMAKHTGRCTGRFSPYSITSQLHTDTTSRMSIYIRTKSESDKAFEYTNDIRDIVKKYYPEEPMW